MKFSVYLKSGNIFDVECDSVIEMFSDSKSDGFSFDNAKHFVHVDMSCVEAIVEIRPIANYIAYDEAKIIRRGKQLSQNVYDAICHADAADKNVLRRTNSGSMSFVPSWIEWWRKKYPYGDPDTLCPLTVYKLYDCDFTGGCKACRRKEIPIRILDKLEGLDASPLDDNSPMPSGHRSQCTGCFCPDGEQGIDGINGRSR